MIGYVCLIVVGQWIERLGKSMCGPRLISNENLNPSYGIRKKRKVADDKHVAQSK